jgi:hypothetical protein
MYCSVAEIVSSQDAEVPFYDGRAVDNEIFKAPVTKESTTQEDIAGSDVRKVHTYMYFQAYYCGHHWSCFISMDKSTEHRTQRFLFA